MATPPADHHIAFLHQLDKLVKGATPINKTDCFAGIRRVDSALEENLDGGENETDGQNEDLKHVLLLKRAQLLKIVVSRVTLRSCVCVCVCVGLYTPIDVSYKVFPHNKEGVYGEYYSGANCEYVSVKMNLIMSIYSY